MIGHIRRLHLQATLVAYGTAGPGYARTDVTIAKRV
jgi:hypothetical protein